MTYVVFTTTQGEEMNEGPTLTSSCHCQAVCVWARVLSFWYHFILPDTWKWSVVFMTTQRRRKARINFQLSNFGQVIAPEQWCLPLVCLTLGNGVLFLQQHRGDEGTTLTSTRLTLVRLFVSGQWYLPFWYHFLV